MTLISCSHNENWEEFWGKNLPTSNEGYAVLKFDDESNLYLGGEHTVTTGMVEDQYQFEEYCLLYSSNDYGRTWDKIHIPKLLGQISHVDVNGKSIVIVNRYTVTG